MTGLSADIAGFERHNVHRWRVYLSRTFAADAMNAADTADAPEVRDGVRGPLEQVVTSDYTRVWKGVLNIRRRCYRLFIKQHLHRSAWDFVKHLFWPGRAMRELRASVMLRDNGFDCPQIAAMGLQKYGPVCVKSFMITTEIPDAKDIYAYLTEDWANVTGRCATVRRRFILQLARTVGRMHAAGICHGDLRPRNIMARRDGDDGDDGDDWHFCFLDNERTGKYRRLPDRLRLKNLVQINMFPTGLSRTDRWRFFKVYMQFNPQVQRRYKHWTAKVMTRTSQRLSRKPYGRNVRL